MELATQCHKNLIIKRQRTAGADEGMETGDMEQCKLHSRQIEVAQKVNNGSMPFDLSIPQVGVHLGKSVLQKHLCFHLYHKMNPQQPGVKAAERLLTDEGRHGHTQQSPVRL